MFRRWYTKAHPQEIRGELVEQRSALWQRWSVFCEVFVTVGIGNRGIGIGIREVPGSRLPVDDIICASDHVEVTHFVDQGASLRVSARKRRLPEDPAQINIVRLVRIYIGIIVLPALAVKGYAGVGHCIGDGRKVALYRVIA